MHSGLFASDLSLPNLFCFHFQDLSRPINMPTTGRGRGVESSKGRAKKLFPPLPRRWPRGRKKEKAMVMSWKRRAGEAPLFSSTSHAAATKLSLGARAVSSDKWFVTRLLPWVEAKNKSPVWVCCSRRQLCLPLAYPGCLFLLVAARAGPQRGQHTPCPAVPSPTHQPSPC